MINKASGKDVAALETLRPASRRAPLKPGCFKERAFIVPEDLRQL